MPLLKDVIQSWAIKKLKNLSSPGEGNGNEKDSDSGNEVAKMAIKHLEWLLSRGYSPGSISTRGYHLGEFVSWLALRGITRVQEVNKAILERYRSHLSHHIKKDGHCLGNKTQQLRLTTIRVLFRWLAKMNYILINPALELELPKIGSSLPPHVLTLKEAEAIMNAVNLSNPLGLRDRAILETLFSTGIRRGELARLKLYDLDGEGGTLTIRHGKGNKDRVVPIGERATAWIEKYISELRPKLAAARHHRERYRDRDKANDHYNYDDAGDTDAIFLTRWGRAFPINSVGNLVTGYVKKAKIGKIGSCHLFRHTMATLMLEGGADIRYIQEMLGHVNLETTQIYTRVSIKQLKEVHKKTHPAALLKRKSKK
jgi:integrase/recombinase XerD